jgi:hypothetical protein
MENKQNIKDLVQKFYPHAKNALGFEPPVRVIMRHDAENAEQSLGSTAYYDPEQKLIVLYVTNRHPKDILRSFSHELVHHAQNCRGDLDDLSTSGRYAEDGKGREIEKEAYLQGNLNVRDWEDSMEDSMEDGIKSKGTNKMNEHYQVTKEELRKTVAEAYREIMAEKKAAKNKVKEMANTGDIKESGFGGGITHDTLSPFERPAGTSPPERTPEEEKAKQCRSIRFKVERSAKPKFRNGVRSLELDIEGEKTMAANPSCFTKEEFEKFGATNYMGQAPEGALDELPSEMEESKKGAPKEIIKEVPRQTKKQPKETNKAWYNTSLYNNLMSKWIKKGEQ